MTYYQNAQKKVSPASIFLPLFNCLGLATAFLHQCRSATAGHGLVPHCLALTFYKLILKALIAKLLQAAPSLWNNCGNYCTYSNHFLKAFLAKLLQTDLVFAARRPTCSKLMLKGQSFVCAVVANWTRVCHATTHLFRAHSQSFVCAVVENWPRVYPPTCSKLILKALLAKLLQIGLVFTGQSAQLCHAQAIEGVIGGWMLAAGQGGLASKPCSR
jgi:hypothetical protein